MSVTIKISELSGTEDGSKIVLIVSYKGKEARIEIGTPDPRFATEPLPERAKRNLDLLLDAIQEWERSSSTILSPVPDQGT
jgi:hypothetical protein